MVIRKAREEEITYLLKEGHKYWHKGRSLSQYVINNRKEEAYGTRYVLEIENEIVSSLILLRLKSIFGYPVFGIGSVLTMPGFENKGYATRLMKACLQPLDLHKEIVFLYSEINPLFYEKLGFQKLPERLQRKEVCSCMILSCEEIKERICKAEFKDIPEYF